MALQENVEKAIKHGQSVIRNSKPNYNLNETTTRYSIIDPILTALGWKLDDPTRCRFEERQDRKGQEYRGQLDYGLYKNDKLLVVIEAKSLSRNMNEFAEENQLKSYDVSPKVKLRVLTNGSHWYFYRNEKDYGRYRHPDINIEYGTLADIEKDNPTGRNATIGEMARELIKNLGYRRL